MDKNVLWYKNKRVEELSKVLLDKEYLIHCVESLEEGKERIISLLNKDKTVALGDTWELNTEEFIERLKECKFFNYMEAGEKKEEIKRDSLTAEIAILEGEFITEDGQIVMVGDYNTSSALFGAENIIILLSENKIVKNLDIALDRVEKLKKYYKLKNEKLGNLNDGLSIGVIENGRKFNKRITLIFTLEDTGL
ncbi:MAG: LUD domain-containing protein [Fusobacterium mortiferum]|jgi:L-lactate utilization protein LutC|uniref:LUD domain-containing protein n=1 Tax=Fusobacterium mortiferum TaxID=850 RepID=UPI001F1656C3|nr:LUD domain-containing protein [Fusobacterium mortiferum]MCF2626495.1 LUD domain-containing protein [Fusobacterium mortiferum]MCI7187309.1 LUD domain-containing protein [Fusobacterium mortiferum]